MAEHYWVHGARRADRAAVVAGLDLPPRLATLDAHRRRRGPYTATGALLRRIVPGLLRRRPDLGPRHYIEIATAAPELADLVPPTLTSLEWRVGEEERTRYYSRLHTLNLANGLAELLREHLREEGGPRSLVIENLHEADATDQEFVAVLLRRPDLAGLTVVAGTGAEPPPDPPGEIVISLAAILQRHARPVPVASARPGPDDQQPGDVEAYLAGDCTDDDPRARAAYAALPETEREARHERRLAELLAIGEPSSALGAVVFHAERAGDRARALELLRLAIRRCRGVGLYQAAADLGMRARARVDREAEPDLWWHFTDATGVCLASLGRADEAAAMYAEARAATQNPLAHMELAYGMAMLYARHYPEPRRDYQQARAWMNLSIAIASQLSDPKARAFHSVFGDNGLALVEVREKGPGEALRLLEAGAARLDAELDPGEQALHRLVLRYNRAQVLGTLGRLEESLADYRSVALADPDFPEHHFNIGNILRRLGREEEAIAAYDTALSKSPPFPEAYYNLGDAKLELGDLEGARADFDYAAVLEPERVETHLSLASVLLRLGRPGPAAAAVATGLELAPDHPRLLSLRAQMLADDGDLEAATTAAEAALAADPELAEAWAIRAELAYRAGDLTRAAADFDRAVELTDRPAFRFNRGVVHQEAGRVEQAATDFRAVLAAAPDPEAAQRLADLETGQPA
jgi:tetratricopeptide (TPR) repeat protein